MRITINKKPILVTDETMQPKDISIPYILTTIAGYFSILWILDYMCFVFFSTHPLPIIAKIGAFFLWLF